MARFVLRGSIRWTIVTTAAGVLAFACVRTPVARAQHGGGHAGGGGHMSGPHVSDSPRSHAAISWPRISAGPPLAGVGTPSFRFPRRPIHPIQPVFPIFRPPVFFRTPFFGFGVGLGFNSLWWPNCGPFWGWGFGCNALPFYGYGFGNYESVYSPDNLEAQTENQQSGPLMYEYEYPPVPAPAYLYGEGSRELAQLYLKDGTVYNITDYWLVNDQLHFTTLDAGGTQSVEHVMVFDQLDLQKTIDVNTQRGFRFVLRNEPLQQYLLDHSDIGPSGAAPPQTGPAGPLQPPALPQEPQPQQSPQPQRRQQP